MYSLNRATILGNCTRDPEMRTTTAGQGVSSFAVATNRAWTDAQGVKQEVVEFHNIVAWGKLAEICSQYLTKGRKVYVEGRIQTRQWEAQDGQKRSTTEIVADNVILLGDRGTAPSGSTIGGSAPSASSASAPPKMNDRAPNPDDEIKIEDIPF